MADLELIQNNPEEIQHAMELEALPQKKNIGKLVNTEKDQEQEGQNKNPNFQESLNQSPSNMQEEVDMKEQSSNRGYTALENE